MSKKFIDIMDTTFRDGFQSVFGGRVLMDDFFDAVNSAQEAGINHFEFGGGARFQSLFFYLNENAFDMMDRFRSIVGDEANLQTLARGVNTVMLDTGSAKLIDLHAKLFKKHGTTTIRNFDALNDVRNLEYSSACISNHGLKNEIVVTMMDLPPGCSGAHDVAFYEKTLRDILDAGIKYDSVCFKDASGTSSPHKVYETIKMARGLLPDDTHIRLHTHETAGVSVACYLSALEAGADGIDLACSPVSGGTSQPDILTMLHAVKGMGYDLGGLETEKILKYQMSLKNALKDYYIPSEATQVSSLIPFSPMPGGALTANTQMMRDNGTMDKFPDAILAMREVVEKGGYGTSVTPVSQFYWQQAYANVVFGKWKQISPGYGKMVLGYFGKTPVAPDKEVIELAKKQLKLEATTRSPIDIANEDETKSLKYWEDKLKKENIQTSEENIFISAACGDKGIEFLKGNAKVSVRKISDMPKETSSQSSDNNEYTVQVNNKSFNVTVSQGHDKTIEIQDIKPIANSTAPSTNTEGETVNATVSGNVFKILKSSSDSIDKDEVVIILESMKMEIEIVSPSSGQIQDILVKEGDVVQEGDALFSIG